MYNLPFNVPEEELELNLILVLMIVYELNSTASGIHMLDNERLQVYLYLVKNPHILNRLLNHLSKKNIALKSYEVSSFKSDKKDINTLYENTSLSYYLTILMSKELIDITYNEKIGFVYIANDKTPKLLSALDSKYFQRAFTFINSLKQTRSTSLSTINKYIKQILHEG